MTEKKLDQQTDNKAARPDQQPSSQPKISTGKDSLDESSLDKVSGGSHPSAA